MSLSIPRNYPGKAPPGERRAMCDYCGHFYYRSTMYRDPGGRLACTDGTCGQNEVVELERENAMAAAMGYPVPVSGSDW